MNAADKFWIRFDNRCRGYRNTHGYQPFTTHATHAAQGVRSNILRAIVSELRLTGDDALPGFITVNWPHAETAEIIEGIEFYLNGG